MNQITNPEEKNPEEKKELLKREEIITMQKDLLFLREEEAKKERERIINLKTEGEKKPIEKPIQTEAPPKKISPPAFHPPIYSKPSSFQKIFIRTVLIVIVILFITFAVVFSYWYSKEMEKISILPSILSPTPTQQETPTPIPILTITPEITPQISPEATGLTPTPTPITTLTPSPTPTPTFSIIDRFVTWGFYPPKKTRLIDTIIIHSVYNAAGDDFYNVEKIINQYKLYKVASHYLISLDGTIYRLISDKYIAYHVGSGTMPDGSRKDIVNNFSIGIELVYLKSESPTEIQYQALAYLIKGLREKYNIPFENILGHKDIISEKTERTDPWNFNWEYFKSLIASQ